MKRLWIISVLVVLLGGALVGLNVTRRRGAEPAPVEPPEASAPPAAAPQPAGTPDDPLLQVEGTSLSGTDLQGRRLWDLRATTLEVDRDRKRIMMNTVTGQFYSGGKAQLTFSAPAAVFDVSSRNVALSGGVVVRALDGRTLRADRVQFDSARRVLMARGEVVLTQPGMFIRADELQTDAALTHPKFSGNIVVRVSE